MNMVGTGSPEVAGRYRRWSFGLAVFDERTLELRIHREAVTVERKPLELLLFLLNHAGEIVTKEEILEAVWPGRILTESVLTKTISKLREALQDHEQAVIRTQHGHGYRLVADVQVEVLTEAGPARLGFKPGDKLTLRPLWSLVEKVGAGGHGEVWLAQHDKTRERRVFKFALDPAALTSLKREITLYRVLHDSLGDAAAIVPILDWNLAEPPYFLEAAHCGANLIDWVELQGGLPRIPLTTRLEIAAQIAEALARAHAVGVLHKDLKPANILIDAVDGSPRVKLSDFGSGSVLDPQRLERLGITRLGLTHGFAEPDVSSGTPSYFAPEVLAGQPFTVQADIYALGVILYELVAGNFRKPFAPGWELDIEDELLREDITATCAGNPAKRLLDASLLADRLRNLETRRQQRREDEAQSRRVERAERAREELKRLRVVAGALLALTVTAMVAGGYAYYSKRQAITAAETTQAVTDFLVKDLLGVANPWNAPARDLTMRKVLKRAAAKVDPNLAHLPEAAREVHLALSTALSAVWEKEAALHHARRYAELTAQSLGTASDQYFGALNWIKNQFIYLGRMEDACGVVDEMAALSGQLDRPSFLRLAVQRMDALACRVVAGDLADFDSQASALLRDIDDHRVEASDAIWEAYPLLARYYWWGAGDLEKAATVHRRLVELAVQKFGERHFITSLFREEWAGNLSALGDFDAAEREMARADSDIRAWIGESGDVGTQAARFTLPFLAMHRLNQGRFAEAEALALANRENVPVTEQRVSDVEWVSAWLLAESHQLNNHCDLALEVTSQALAPRPRGDVHWYAYSLSMPVHQVAADCLRERGDLAGAWAVLDRIPPEVIAAYPEKSPFLAFFLYARGLLYMHEGENDLARADLGRVVELFEALDPKGASWRVARAREDLARIPASGSRSNSVVDR